MTQYKHSSITPIIEGICNVLTHLGENDSKAYLLKQYKLDDTFKELAKNLRKWKTEFVDIKPPVKNKLIHALHSLNEYFEERKVLEIYLGQKNENSYFSPDTFLDAFSIDEPLI